MCLLPVALGLVTLPLSLVSYVTWFFVFVFLINYNSIILCLPTAALNYKVFFFVSVIEFWITPFIALRRKGSQMKKKKTCCLDHRYHHKSEKLFVAKRMEYRYHIMSFTMEFSQSLLILTLQIISSLSLGQLRNPLPPAKESKLVFL